MVVARTALSLTLGLLFIVTGGVKVLKVPKSLEIRDHLGLAPTLWTVVGAAESAGGAGLLLGLAFGWIGIAAAVGLSLLMTGAIISRLRVHDPAAVLLTDLVVLALVLTELGVAAVASA